MRSYSTHKAVTMLAVVFAILLTGLTSGKASATDYAFTGLAATCPFPPGECGSFVPGQPDNWGDNRNWSPHGVPGAGDTATIGGFTVKINGTRTVSRLTLSGSLTTGTLNLAGPSGSFVSSWTGGGNLSCTLNVAAGAALSISGDDNRFVTSATINNSGTITWTGGASLLCQSTSTFNNKSGGVFNAQNNSSLIFFAAPQSTFNNLTGAVFNKSGAGTITSILTFFNNSGTVNGLSGTLSADGGGASNGTFTAANAARVDVSGSLSGTFNAAAGGIIGIKEGNSVPTRLGTGAKFLGAGASQVFSGLVTAIGTITAGQTGGPGTLRITGGGTLAGTSTSKLNTAGTGTYDWANGNMGIAGSILNIGAGAQFLMTGDENRFFTSGTINNSGIVTWTGGGSILTQSAAVFNNKTGGVFNANNNSAFIFFAAPACLFSNQAGATFNKNGAGTTTVFNTPFSNAGTVNGLGGLLTLDAGGTSTGTFTAASGGRVNVSGALSGTFIPAAGGIIGLQEGSPAPTNLGVNTKILGAGITKVFAGTVQFNAKITIGQTGAPGTLTLEGGTFSGNPAGHLITAGAGFVDWTTGALADTINIDPGCQFRISGPENRFLNNATVNNSGTVTWTGGGSILGQTGSVFNNKSGANFNAQNNSSLLTFSSPPTVFNNLAGGTVTKSGAGTLTDFSVAFNNLDTGLLNAVSGRVTLAPGSSTGIFQSAAGANIDFGEPYTFKTGTRFRGTGCRTNGQVKFDGTTLVENGGNFEMGSGSVVGTSASNLTTAGTGVYKWTGANIGAAGSNLNIGVGANFEISGDSNRFITTGVINNNGIVTWTGGASILVNDGAVFNNKSGGIFNANNNSSFTFFSAPKGLFANQAGAIFEKRGAGTTSEFTTNFTNAGFVYSREGILALSADPIQTGGAIGLAGGSLTTTKLLMKAGILLGDGAITGNVTNSAGQVAPIGPGGVPGTITQNGNYLQGAGGQIALQVGGVNAGTQYDQLKVNGTVSLAGTLILDFTFSPAVGNTFTIIDNDGEDPVTGIFSGLANNATFVADGQLLRINYNGGSGNDVVLTRLAPPTVNIADASQTEGNAGTANMTFNVTLSTALSQTVTVDYQINHITTNVEDLIAAGGQVTFAAGQTSKQILVPIKGDTLDEDDEQFTVALNNATIAQLGDGEATGTILDNDAAPSLAISNFTVTEGSSGTTNADFTVSLSAASGRTVSVKFATANGSATAPADFAAASGTLTFAPGETSKTITVAVKGDLSDEVNETFDVGLNTPVNATIADATGTGTIIDDDGPGIIINNPASINEGNAGTTNAVFTVLLSAPSVANTTVQFATSDFTATAGEDYVAKSGTLTILAGQTSGTITVAVMGDAIIEENEAFRVTLSNPVNGLLVDGSAAVYIINDDGTAGAKRPRGGLILSSASASATAQSVTLNFTGKLPAGAADPSVWGVVVDAGNVDVESVSVTGSTVTLTLAAGTLHTGDAVEVAWDGLPGLAGGSAGPVTAR